MFAANAGAQDLSDMFGTWSVTGSGSYEYPDCGRKSIEGSLRVLQRATDDNEEVYHALLSFEERFETCDTINQQEVHTFIKVNGDSVQLTYADPTWSPDMLVRTGDVMEGSDSSRFRTRWIKIAGPSDAQRAAEVKSNLANQLYGENADAMRYVLRSNGMSESEAEERLWQLFDAEAACMVDSLRASAARQSLSFYELVNLIDPAATGITNQELLDKFDNSANRTLEQACVDEEFRKLGIRTD